MAALWRVGLEARGFSLFLVVLVTIFVVLWVGIGSGIHKHYETPTPVRPFHVLSFATCSHIHRPHSIGAGSAPLSRAIA